MEIIKAVARRSPGNWIAEFTYDGTAYVASGTTWSRLNDSMRELIGDRDRGQIHLAWHFQDPELEDLHAEFHAARSDAIAANVRMEEALRDIARELVHISSTRDAGAILGYSHQYMAKVVK